MRRCGRGGCWGLVAIIVGVVIILAILLPSQFWWILLAAAFIAFGVWLMRRC